MDAAERSAHARLVSRLVEEGYLRTPAIISAFRALPRAGFVRAEDRAVASSDEPLGIGSGQTTSAPSIIAMMLELLRPRPGNAVLEIGTGLGWTTALLSRLARAEPRSADRGKRSQGTVVSYELEPDLAEQARANLRRARALADVRTGDGTRAPGSYDRILLKCAAPEIPGALLEKLNAGGRLVAPIGPRDVQELVCVEKSRGALRLTRHGACRFVPLR